jgi:beta-glucosidase
MYLLSLCFLFVVTNAKISTLYKDSTQPIPVRVADLVSQMTLEELIAAVAHKDGDTDGDLRRVYGNTSIGGVKITLFTVNQNGPKETIEARNAFQAFMIQNSRLNIPVSVAHEGLHSGSFFGTVFPEPLLTGCTWNDTLVSKIGAVLGDEARAYGVDNSWSPVVNMWQDDRFGRFQEGFSPDPTITSHMGRSIVIGMQGGVSSQDDYLPDFNTTCWSTGKHFAGYGSAVGGLNGAPFTLNNRSLFEQFFKPWRSLAAVGIRGVMPSHNSVLDVPMHLNKWAINDVLRNEFGFGNGMTVSDCNDIGSSLQFGVATNMSQIVGWAMKAGLDADLQCGYTEQTASYLQWIPNAINDGFATIEDLQKLAGHYLTQKFAAGLFDAPYTDPSWVDRLNTPASRALAYEAATQGIVLLQNENKTLPLSFGNKINKVALIGPMMTCGGRNGTTNCFAREAMLGSYTLDSGAIEVDTIPIALSKRFSSLTVTVTDGASPDNYDTSGIAQAVTNAQNADVAIVAVGDSLTSCGEWLDRDSLDLPGAQLQLLEALVATNTPIVLVLINGRAASFGPGNVLLTKIAAVVEAYRPGEMGANAIVDILSGLVNPSGKLASQWAQHVGQLGSGAQPWLARRVAKWLANGRSVPDATDGRMYDPYISTEYSSLPLFRFGHGLSYTTFSYSSLTISGVQPVHSLPGGGVFSGRGGQGYKDAINTIAFTAHVTLCNTGSIDGTEVVQLYSQDPRGMFPTPVVQYWKRLIGYGRIILLAGSCGTLDINVVADDIALYDDVMTLRVVPGTYIITAGGRSDQDFQAQNVTLVG